MNPNTREHWDSRFGSGEWERSEGRSQTRLLAEAQVARFPIRPAFDGSILDFGCGLGDAIPVYRRRWPLAELSGMDFSGEAIARCRALFGKDAAFIEGTHRDVRFTDVIVASNVVEHITEDRDVVKALRDACRLLLVVVPYREVLVPGSEHIHSYDVDSFEPLGGQPGTPFASRGWSEYGSGLWVNVYAKNLVRPLLGRPTQRRHKQIIFRFGRL